MIATTRWPLLLLLTTIASLGSQCVWGQDEDSADPSKPDSKGIGYWVTQLDNDNYLRREMASKKLVEAGPAAIPELIHVIRRGDLEVVERATVAIVEIALSRAPDEDGGAWDQLNLLAAQSAGRRASSARSAIDEIREDRATQARNALAAAGVFVGVDEFAISAISQRRMMVQIDEKWHGDAKSLVWLRWLSGVQHATVKGAAIDRDVLTAVAKIPGLQSLAIVDGEVASETLEPLKSMDRIKSLEFRYVKLSEDQGDLIASMPIRTSLNLMGTGISEQKVASMQSARPGLRIDYRKGGFLGVKCMDGFDVCEINEVVPNSAAEAAGLIKGDVIVRVGETEVNRFRDLQKAINQHSPGDELQVKFQRGDKIETVKLNLRRFEDP